MSLTDTFVHVFSFGTVSPVTIPVIDEDTAIATPGYFLPSSFGGWKTGEVCQWIERQKAKGFSETFILGTLKGRLTTQSYNDVVNTLHHPLSDWSLTIPVGSYNPQYPPCKGPADEVIKAVDNITIPGLPNGGGLSNLMIYALAGMFLLLVIIMAVKK